MIEVLVSNSLIDRCRDYAEAIIENYRLGLNERSRLCGMLGADTNAQAQMIGKLCEVAAAISMGIDPVDDLKWDANVADFGWDFIFMGKRFDVKGTDHPRARCLIWPQSKTHLFADKRFDAMLMVWADRARLGYCEVRGWISKADFDEQHLVAKAHSRFVEGTWYLPQDRLRPMSDLLAYGKAA